MTATAKVERSDDARPSSPVRTGARTRPASRSRQASRRRAAARQLDKTVHVREQIPGDMKYLHTVATSSNAQRDLFHSWPAAPEPRDSVREYEIETGNTDETRVELEAVATTTRSAISSTLADRADPARRRTRGRGGAKSRRGIFISIDRGPDIRFGGPDSACASAVPTARTWMSGQVRRPPCSRRVRRSGRQNRLR